MAKNSTRLVPNRCSECGASLLFPKWSEVGERWIQCKCGNKSNPMIANPGKVVREWNKHNDISHA